MRFAARNALITPLAAAGLAVVGLAVPVVAAATPSSTPTASPTAAARDAAAARGPIGWDTYRHLDRFAQVPHGVQTKQFSSFDRTGGNGDFNRCLSTRTDGSCVLAQADGAGEVDNIWSTRDGGDVTATGNITVVLDGKTIIHAPFQDVVDGKLGAPFVYPVVANADQSSGGVDIDAPMTYRKSMLIYTDKDPNYYHVTYRTFADPTGVKTFDPSDQANDVIATLKAAGTADPKPVAANAATQSSSFTLAPGKSRTLADEHGSGSVSALRLQVPDLKGPPKPDYLPDDGRAFGAGGYSQFTVKIDPNNDGVRLTRRADEGIGHQVADVSVDGTKVTQWKANEVAGSCKWKDEYVDLPASVTKGKSSITIRNTFVSSDLDFNEFHYWVDSTVGGKAVRTDELDVGPDHTADEQAHDYSIVKQTFQGTWSYCYTSSVTSDPDVERSNDIVQDVRVRVTADGVRTVDAPLGEFFGNGQSDNDVKSLMTSMGDGLSNWFSAWWPMPYASSLKVTLYNGSSHPLTTAKSAVTAARDPQAARDLRAHRIGYFRATNNAGPTTPGQDHPFLDANGTGKFVGVAENMVGPGTRAFLEGDERVYVDGALTPQIHGTGTEDYFQGGWYFNRDRFTDPFNGNPAHQGGSYGCPENSDCTATYRLQVADAVPFGSSLHFGIEHGPTDDVQADYSSTAFWYDASMFTQRVTDTVDVGDAASVKQHGYTPAGTTTPLTSTYEGNNAAPQPVTAQVGTATGRTSFRVKVAHGNQGVTLRRTSDQAKPNQQASVLVDGRRVGTWTELLDNPDHRWLDDTFGISSSYTAGKNAITVTLVPTKDSAPWTAARYVVQSQVNPFTDTTAPGAVSGLRATAGDSNAVTLSWTPATDDTGIDHYDVYAAQADRVPVDKAHRVGSTRVPGFTHTDLGLNETWHYRVVAVDDANHRSRGSATVSATTGNSLRIEAESLLPPVEATAGAESQANCCGANWSGGAQLWFRASSAPQHVTLALKVPTTGTYKIVSAQTSAPDYGITTLAMDGKTIGQPIDGYHAGGVAVATADDGTLELTAGTHQLTLTVTGKNPAAAGYLAGLDYLDMTLTA